MLYPSGSHWNTWRDGATWAGRDPSKFPSLLLYVHSNSWALFYKCEV